MVNDNFRAYKILSILMAMLALVLALRPVYWYLEDPDSLDKDLVEVQEWFVAQLPKGIEVSPPSEGKYEEEIHEFEEITVTFLLREEEIPLLLKFFVKLSFSIVLGGAALFVVLSRRYDDETRKWAFSILSLISGVWIGSVT